MGDNLVFDLLDQRVIDGQFEQTVVRAGKRDLDVAALVELSGSYGGALRQWGAEPGRAVRLGSVDSLASVVALLGVLRIGAVVDLADAAELDATDLDYGVAIGAGRTDPADATRVADDAPAVVLPDRSVVTHRDLVAAVTAEDRFEGAFGTILAALRALQRGDVLVYAA